MEILEVQTPGGRPFAAVHVGPYSAPGAVAADVLSSRLPVPTARETGCTASGYSSRHAGTHGSGVSAGAAGPGARGLAGGRARQGRDDAPRAAPRRRGHRLPLRPAARARA